MRYVFFVFAALLLLFGVHTPQKHRRPAATLFACCPPAMRIAQAAPAALESKRGAAWARHADAGQSQPGDVAAPPLLAPRRPARLFADRARSADPRVLRRAPWTELVQIVPLGQQPVVVRNYAQQMDRQAPPPNAAFTAFAPSASTPSRHTHSARSTNCHNRPQSTRLPQLPQSHRVHIALPRRHPAPLRRQAALVAQAMVRGQKDGLSHLMTIDDDELLFCPAGCAALHAALAAAPEPVLVLHNLEASRRPTSW